MPISALVREQLFLSLTAFSISRHFRALRPHASTLKDDLIVFKKEEYHFYMVPCLDHGDPPTARETGEEMSNESAELEDEDIQRDTKDLRHKIRKKVKASKRIIVLILLLT